MSQHTRIIPAISGHASKFGFNFDCNCCEANFEVIVELKPHAHLSDELQVDVFSVNKEALPINGRVK